LLTFRHFADDAALAANSWRAYGLRMAFAMHLQVQPERESSDSAAITIDKENDP